jgi:hypothetical protein
MLRANDHHRCSVSIHDNTREADAILMGRMHMYIIGVLFLNSSSDLSSVQIDFISPSKRRLVFSYRWIDVDIIRSEGFRIFGVDALISTFCDCPGRYCYLGR